MTRKARPWAKTFGGHGSTVSVRERPGRPHLYLRWWDSGRANWRWRSLGHADRALGESQARQLTATLVTAVDADARGTLTVAALFARFEGEVMAHARPIPAAEDRRRLALWTATLGPDREVRRVDRAALDAFVRDRRAGRLEVPGYDLKPNPSDRTIGADLEFLRRVFNWGMTLTRRDGSPLVERNPIIGFPIPHTANPKRPVATHERYLAVRAKADAVDPQGLFGPFLDLIEGLGWRVSAVCQLQGSDLDLTASEAAPFGRIQKRAESDKEKVQQWLPMAGNVRAAVLAALERNPVAGTAPLFPAPRAATKLSAQNIRRLTPDGEFGRPNPWTRHHARELLSRAERLARLDPLEGGDFHPYRRAWATARKHLPLADVAAAGGWKTTETLLRCYQRPDDATTYAVVSETRKVRSIGGVP